jgi:UDP-N-acetylmuramoylalanine--D-glutamate ligase
VTGTRPERPSRGDAWPPRRALVVGLARSGRAAALALARRGVEVVAADRSSAVDVGRLAAAGVELRLGTEEESLLEGIDLVVKSPGVPGEAPLAAGARALSIPVWSEVELGYRLLPPSARMIGVTGTNGKTTTTELLAAILRADERPVEVAGNIGRALTEAAEAAGPESWVVCELSSFQLEDVQTLACDVAVLLNLEPDHLDRHAGFDAYRDAKLRIFERARVRVVPRGFDIGGIGFSADDSLPAEPVIPGRHNRENAAAATAAARAVDVPDEAIARALRAFPGVPHRLELVRELRGVRWVNDSKATNTAAARRGIAAYDAPLRLVLGGSLKGEDFRSFAQDLPENVRSIYLVGGPPAEHASAHPDRARCGARCRRPRLRSRRRPTGCG